MISKETLKQAIIDSFLFYRNGKAVSLRMKTSLAKNYKQLCKEATSEQQLENLERLLAHYPALAPLRSLTAEAARKGDGKHGTTRTSAINLFLAAYNALNEKNLCSNPYMVCSQAVIEEAASFFLHLYSENPEEYKDAISQSTLDSFFNFLMEGIEKLTMIQVERDCYIKLIFQWCMCLKCALSDELLDDDGKDDTEENNVIIKHFNICFFNNMLIDKILSLDLDEVADDMNLDDEDDDEISDIVGELRYHPRPYDFDQANLNVFKLHVILRGWRYSVDLLVREDMTFEELHRFLTIHFERFDDHFYHFDCSSGISFLSPNERDLGVPGCQYQPYAFADEAYLGHFLAPGQNIFYLFDYGDEWKHDITVKKVFPLVPGEHYPVILKTKGEIPPQYPELEDDED